MLSEGWEVHGTANIPAQGEEANQITLHHVNFLNSGELKKLLERLEPELVVNLAAMSSVAKSWQNLSETLRVNTQAVAEIGEYLLENNDTETRVVQASSSEIFGDSDTSICNEDTPIRPTNPYGVSKAASHQLGQTFRNAGTRWSNAILFNHESPRRPEAFLSRKVSMSVARIHLGLQKHIELGALSSSRDWGWAPDYARALALVASLEDPQDFVVATGVAHSVKDFVASAFRAVGISEWQEFVIQNSEFVRPTDVRVCVGDATRIRNASGWTPTFTFEQIVESMVLHDIELLRRQAHA